VTLTSDPVTLNFGLWPSTSAVYRLWRGETLYQIWTQSNNSRRSYCDFSVWPYDLEHVLTVALDSGIIFIKFDLRQLIRAWIIAFFDDDTLCHAVTLTFDPLTLKVRGTSSVTWSKSVQNFERNRALQSSEVAVDRQESMVLQRYVRPCIPLNVLRNNWTRGKQPANIPAPQSTTPGLHPVSIHQMTPPERTSDCSSLLIYRPRKDERLSWPSWLTCSGRFTHITGHSSDAGRAQDRESSPSKDRWDCLSWHVSI